MQMQVLQESNRAELEGKCYTDFAFFCEEIVGLQLSEFHKELLEIPLKHQYGCIVVPTGHGKTSLFTIAYSLWRAWSNKNIEVCIVSGSLEQSMRFLGKIQDILENNPFFGRMLPRNRFDSWNKSSMKLSNGSEIYVKPFTSTARGIHPHFIIYDDLLRENDTPMDIIKETFWGIFYPRGQINNCQHLLVGTPLSANDLYSDLEKKSDWHVVRKQAVQTTESGKWLKSLWPERFSLKDLQRIRDNMNSVNFEREYMCNPRAAGSELFPQEMLLNCLDDGLEYSYDSKGTIYTGADFAMSTKSSGDYNAFIVVDSFQGKHLKKNGKETVEVENPIILRQVRRFRGSTGQVETLSTLNDYFPGSMIVADSSNVGAKFVPELRQKNLVVEAQDFRPANRNMLLMNLRRVIEQGRLVIPNKGDATVYTDIILRELAAFNLHKTKAGSESWQSTINHDDTSMALALAVKNVTNPTHVSETFIVGL